MTPPTTPAVQVTPDVATMASGETQFVQVLASAGSATSTSLSASSSSAALSVPASVPIAAGGGFAQFQVTANPVTAATPATLTVTYGTASGTALIAVHPASAPALASFLLHPPGRSRRRRDQRHATTAGLGPARRGHGQPAQ